MDQQQTQPWVVPSDIELFSRVFVDDTMNGIAGPIDRPMRAKEQLWMLRATLHAIHAIFPPPDCTSKTEGKDSISEKKLRKAMLDFKQTETLLGFAMRGGSGRNRTVQLPLDRKEKYSAQIQTAISKPKRYVPLKTFQEIHGKLILSSNAIPCICGLLTPLNRQLALGP